MSEPTFVFPAGIDPLSFITLNPDNTVVITCQVFEMGQGSYTAAATLAGDELDADWSQLRVVPAPLGQQYGNPLFGGGQGTGGQTGTHGSFLKMRNAGAAMRAMIVAAAANRWGVDASGISVSSGVVTGTQGQSLTFGELAEEAMKQPVPETVALKTPDQFTFIGNSNVRRVDAYDKMHGTAKFTFDIKLPGMLTAVVVHHQRPGQKIVSVDAEAALAFPGVTNVFEVETGIAVVGTNFWSVYEAGNLIKVEWDDSNSWRMGTEEMYAEMRTAVDSGDGVSAVEIGDVDAGLASAAATITRHTTVPYTAHAPFETLNIICRLRDGQLDVWGGLQMFYMDVPQLAEAAGIDPSKVVFHPQMAGGSFGRRATPQSVPGRQAIEIINKLGTDQPVKVMYSREDDMSSPYNYYRPGFVHRIDAGVDVDGKLVAFKQTAAGQSVAKGTMLEGFSIRDGIDDFSVEGGRETPYAVANRRMTLHTLDYPYRVSWLRSSGTFHNVFAIETTIDQLAHKIGKDPIQFRLDNLPADARERGCLEELIERAGLDTPLTPDKYGRRRGRGVALAPSHRSYSATVIEVTVANDNSNYTLDRVVTVQDCGLVVNPDNVVAQMEGSVAFGLTMARFGEISITDGKIDQVFYSDLHVTRFHTMPKEMHMYVRASEEGPSGASETIVCTIAPALANALADATGEDHTRLPLVLDKEPAQSWPVPSPMNSFLDV